MRTITQDMASKVAKLASPQEFERLAVLQFQIDTFPQSKERNQACDDCDSLVLAIIGRDDGSLHAPNVSRSFSAIPSAELNNAEELDCLSPTAEIGDAVRRLLADGHSWQYVASTLNCIAKQIREHHEKK